jgi:hypothetical protein
MWMKVWMVASVVWWSSSCLVLLMVSLVMLWVCLMLLVVDGKGGAFEKEEGDPGFK